MTYELGDRALPQSLTSRELPFEAMSLRLNDRFRAIHSLSKSEVRLIQTVGTFQFDSP